jgi:hypothetical protein
VGRSENGSGRKSRKIRMCVCGKGEEREEGRGEAGGKSVRRRTMSADTR